jgi:hypothetical protein
MFLWRDSPNRKMDYIYVAKSSCLFGQSECGDDIGYEVEVYSGNNSLFDITGNNVLIADYYVEDDGTGALTEGRTVIKSLNTETGEIQLVTEAQKGSRMLNISQDGKWLLMMNSITYSYSLMSVDGSQWINLSGILGRNIDFIGWLYKP